MDKTGSLRTTGFGQWPFRRSRAPKENGGDCCRRSSTAFSGSTAPSRPSPAHTGIIKSQAFTGVPDADCHCFRRRQSTTPAPVGRAFTHRSTRRTWRRRTTTAWACIGSKCIAPPVVVTWGMYFPMAPLLRGYATASTRQRSLLKQRRQPKALAFRRLAAQLLGPACGHPASRVQRQKGHKPVAERTPAPKAPATGPRLKVLHAGVQKTWPQTE